MMCTPSLMAHTPAEVGQVVDTRRVDESETLRMRMIRTLGRYLGSVAIDLFSPVGNAEDKARAVDFVAPPRGRECGKCSSDMTAPLGIRRDDFILKKVHLRGFHDPLDEQTGRPVPVRTQWLRSGRISLVRKKVISKTATSDLGLRKSSLNVRQPLML